MPTAVNHRLSSDLQTIVRGRLVCSTPELSQRVYILRHNFHQRIIRSPASLWSVKNQLEEILWKRARAEWKVNKQ